MTTLTALAGPPSATRTRDLRPLPWRRMAWVTWRQHRAALTGVAVLLVVLAVGFWIAGLHLHHAYAAAIACHPASSFACNNLVTSFNGLYGFLANGFILQVVPALIGAFLGAPVLARELESGTFRFAWTQGFGRWRWTLAKLVALGVMVTAVAGAISVLFSWYYQPYFPAGNQVLYVSKSSRSAHLPRSLPACSICAGSRSPPGRSRPSLSVSWPASSFAGSSPRSSPPWSSTPGSPSRPAGSCASTTWRRWSPAS